MLTLLLLGAGLYLAICAAMYFAQSRLLFPTWLAERSAALPIGAEQFSVSAPDGTKLQGIYLAPARGAGDGILILSFAGNATNAQDLAERLRITFPEHSIVAFHYRGYRPSTGIAGAEAMAEDAPLVFDEVVRRYRPQRVVAVGVSLGSGVAASLAARRPLAGAILVTPFDSLKNVAREIYWWLPVSLLMRHDLDSVASLAAAQVPVAIIAAERDSLVRPRRTEALRGAALDLRHDVTLEGASHNDIFLHPNFDPALRQALEQVTEG